MLFLLNNPWVAVIGFLVIGLVTFVGMKIVRELNYNKMLKHKQGVMRVDKGAKRVFNKRVGVLSSAALAPVIVLTLVLTIGTQTSTVDTGNIFALNDGKDVEEVYDDFVTRTGQFNNYQIFPTFFKAVQEDAGLDFDMETAMTDSILIENTVRYTSGVTSTYEGTASDDYSKTNTQVVGVDEMDNVLTDGKYVYTIDDNKVHITLAYTVEDGPTVLDNYKTISYDVTDEEECTSGFMISGMYVDEDYLVVLGYEYDQYCSEDEEKPDSAEAIIEYYDWWYQDRSSDMTVHVYDKSNDFADLSTYKISGTMIGTRKIDDNLIIVTSSYIPFNDDSLNVDEYLPSYTVGETTITAEYEDVVYVEGISPNSFTTFYCLDLDNEEVDMEVVLGDSGYNLYVSNNNIYLVGNIYYFTAMTEMFNVEEPIEETKTAILKISINNDDLEYERVGSVVGTTLNQFSMDETNGYLRIATTSGSWMSVNNQIYVLDMDLEIVGNIDGLGKPGERIKSVRFSGGYGYLVTFLQTDPFYVVDLTNPQNPTKVGELEIPGFSSYLQPLGDNFMLGIGYGDNSGGTNGLKISIYDISDKTNPIVFDEVIYDYNEVGWGDSSATYNHKDLLVDMGKGIIALPFSTHNYVSSLGEYRYNSGILVYNFDETNGLDYSGYIQHETDAEYNVYVYKVKFISDFFYSISNKYVMVSEIDDPEVIVEQVTLPQE